LVDDSGKLRIAGFGLSMLLAEADNEIFDSVYSRNPRWNAPELLMLDCDLEDSEQKPTKAGDIYSFGCVMLQVCCDPGQSTAFLTWSKIISGKEPYTWAKRISQVVCGIVLGRAPFDAVQIDMNSSQRQLSSRCLSREPKGRPSIVEITTIIGHPVTRQPSSAL
jgi:serine/threonine protein kinase